MDQEIGLGHNKPPQDDESFRAELLAENAKLFDRASEIVKAIDRLPAEITDDEWATKAGDFVKMLTECRKAIEATRESAKAPILARGKLIDGVFVAYRDRLDTVKQTVQSRLTVFARAKEAAARRKLQEEAEARQREAERLAAEAKTAEHVDVATAVADEAAKIQHKADTASSADMARTRSDMGSVVSLRTIRKVRILDFDKLDLNLLRPYISKDAVEMALRQAMKSKREFDSPALEYYDDKSAQVS